MKILIIGGYGIFGGRLVELLAPMSGLQLVVAGRSLAKARDFCSRCQGAVANLASAQFDRDGNVAAQLLALAPDIVVDATGPFQAYGAHPYRMVEACIEQGVNYLDLADASDFVRGIARYDEQARERGVFVLSGVSSFPVLTAAVVRHLAPSFAKIRTVVGGIAPSPYAGVGPNVIRAITAYAGKTVALVRGGRLTKAYGLTETRRFTIAPPGRIPLRNLRFSLVDVPDLTLIPDLVPGLDSIWIGAGPVPEVLHRALNGLAWLVRLRLLPTLVWFAPLIHWVTNHVRWGEHRGGMFVRLEGEGCDGASLSRSWHLLAEGADGPYIPSMAIEAVIRRIRAGQIPVPGARPALDALELDDYDRIFAGRRIYTGVREDCADEVVQAHGGSGYSLYRRLLGGAFERLPLPLQQLHDGTTTWSAAGEVRIERGSNLLAGWVARLFRFPPASEHLGVRVRWIAEPGREQWERHFGDHVMRSVQELGQGREQGLLIEKFGPLAFAMAVEHSEGQLRLVLRHWRLGRIRLPFAWAPTAFAFESVEQGRFCFHVDIGHRWLGRIVRYVGWLRVDTASDTDLLAA